MNQPQDPDARSTPRLYGIAAALFLVVMVAGLGFLVARPTTLKPNTATVAKRGSKPTSPYRNTVAEVAYVGDKECAQCHEEIAQTYRHHPMGRSMSPVPGADPPANGTVFTFGDLVYSVLCRDGRVIHREERRDAQGRTVATTEAVVRFMLGSGQRGLAFLVEKGDGLFQSPITWYARERRWGLSPLFDKHNLHFDRPVSNGCLYCHANRVEVSADAQVAQFHGTAIGCESCHGPGALHVQHPVAVDGTDWTIVNPAHLEPVALREAVCEQCHLQGSSRRNQPGTSIFDYRPGLPLEAFVAVSYGLADPISNRRAVGHVEQMKQSGCYKGSGGELGCISCHDPHQAPEPSERVSYYQRRCLECHAEQGCSLPRARRLARSPEDDCTLCHMPQSPSSDVAHAAVTMHTIPRHLAASN